MQRIKDALEKADLVLIGASNGIDMAEGLNIFRPDAHFQEHYADLGGAPSFLHGLFGARHDPAALWAWAARFAVVENLDYEPGEIMTTLRQLVGDTDSFVLTCNMNGHFVRAGFENILETEGSLHEAVCGAGCSDTRYPLGEKARELNASITNGRVDENLIPRCPNCGEMLIPASDEARLHRADTALRAEIENLSQLVEKHRGDNIVVLELGVGLRNGVIKDLLYQLVGAEENLLYAIFNYNQVVTPRGLEEKTVGVDGDMNEAFMKLASAEGKNFGQ